MASQGVNKAIIVGNLGADPDLRYTAAGTAVANASVATTEAWTDKQSGARQEQTEWHRVTFWARLAEVVGQYLAKGSKVYIEGRLQTRKWTGQDGQDRYTTEIVAATMQMLDTRGGASAGPARRTATAPTGSQASAADYRRASQGGAPAAPAQPAPADALDDDIPF